MATTDCRAGISFRNSKVQFTRIIDEHDTRTTHQRTSFHILFHTGPCNKPPDFISLYFYRSEKLFFNRYTYKLQTRKRDEITQKEG